MSRPPMTSCTRTVPSSRTNAKAFESHRHEGATAAALPCTVKSCVPLPQMSCTSSPRRPWSRYATRIGNGAQTGSVGVPAYRQPPRNLPRPDLHGAQVARTGLDGVERSGAGGEAGQVRAGGRPCSPRGDGEAVVSDQRGDRLSGSDGRRPVVGRRSRRARAAGGERRADAGQPAVGCGERHPARDEGRDAGGEQQREPSAARAADVGRRRQRLERRAQSAVGHPRVRAGRLAERPLEAAFKLARHRAPSPSRAGPRDRARAGSGSCRPAARAAPRSPPACAPSRSAAR